MISAPNPQLLLNGNKSIVLFICLFLGSIHLAAQAKEEDDETINNQVEIVNPYSYMDTMTVFTKPIYNIAFVLPIMKSNIKVGDGKNTQTSMSYETREALGFWEGVTLAFPKIKSLNSKFNLHLWDNAKDDSATLDILSQFKKNKIDAVVAPFHTKQAMLVSQYCKDKKIPMFLAQNPSDIPAKDNPFTFKFHSPKNRVFYNYYKKITQDISEANSKIYFIYDATVKSERKVANFMKFMSEKDSTQRIQMIEYKNEHTTGYNFNLLDSTLKNIFIISYHQEPIINEILTALRSLNNNNIQVLVQGTVAKSTKINRENLAYLNAVSYSDFFLDKNNLLQETIKKNYIAKTKDNFISDVYLGYDVANYICELYNRYGMKFPLSIDKFKYVGSINNYLFKPQYDAKGNILFFENKSNFLLKATENGWVISE